LKRGAWIAIIAAEIIALCCCAGLGVLFLAGNFSGVPVTPTAIAQATLTPFRATLTPAPTQTVALTSTPLIQLRATAASPTFTRAFVTPSSNLYNIVIPTPTAPPKLNYPIDYKNTFVVVTYPVTGTTTNAVSKSLEANAIADPHEPNNHFYARTDWYLSAHWLWKETPRGCEVDRADVSIALTMTLPALSIPNVPSDLQNRWNTFIKNGVTHESGHVKLAQDGARVFQRDLGNFPPAPNCDVIQTRLRELFDKSFLAIDQANVKYDADTQHGVTQGAVFP